jgi:hypothetical protein
MPDETASEDTFKLPSDERLGAYAAKRFIGGALERRLGLQIPFTVYFQDPLVARTEPKLAFDEIFVSWEPGLSDGPTSARFAVVDYDAHTETLTPPARWDAKRNTFVDPADKALDRSNTKPLQFHHVNAWALLQRALEFFEESNALGRRIPWAFEGNRLIVVPHAGPTQNAYYDRRSKSLQFYYFDSDDERIYTSLSTDIVHHEFGHAVLDGIRPGYIEAVFPETAAFHEFVGDLTSILLALRNNAFREHLLAETEGDLSKESTLSKVAEQFGTFVQDKPYLRSARNSLTMRDVAGDQRPHFMSEVLTGAMFDIVIELSKYYMKTRKRTAREAFFNTIQRMQHMALQPLDLLPPADVTFRDYALAVLRAEETANPTDPDDYRGQMLDVFVKRGILEAADRTVLRKPHQLFDRIDLDVFHDAHTIGSSRSDAYRFLDDNRRKLFIPRQADLASVDVCTARKFTREARRLPAQVILQYVWREDVSLDGPQFGRFDGQKTTMACGGTLVLNETGDLVAWARKPGSQPTGRSSEAIEEQRQGGARRKTFLETLAARINAGVIGAALGGAKGLLPRSIAPLTSRIVDSALRFELAPHVGIHDDRNDALGGRRWQISS